MRTVKLPSSANLARFATIGAITLGAILCLGPCENPGIALLLGAALALTLGNPAPKRTKMVSQRALFIAVAGLGDRIGLRTRADVGARGIVGTVAGIVFCATVGVALSRVIRIESKLALLVTVGTAICGGSAIAAVAPVVHARDDESSLALATVFVLNAIALFLFPAIGHLTHMTGHQFGWWSAVAIHDTSSVVGAALRFGDGAVDLAVPLKLTRALYIVPVAVVAGAIAKRGAAEKTATKIPMPWLALAFLGVCVAFSILPALAPMRAHVVDLARRVMGFAIFFVGLGLTRPALARVSGRVLAFGATLWLATAAVTLAGVVCLVTR